MLDTVLDIEVLKKFMLDRPNTLAFEDIESHEQWNDFYRFIKSGTNLELAIDNINLNSPIISLINNLTTGRNGTSFKQVKLKRFHKDKLPNGFNIQTLFFLNNSKEQADKLKKKNGLAFSSIGSYSEDWRILNFNCKSSVFSIFKERDNFKTWEKIEEYVYAITDMVIIDAYIFSDSSLLKSNLYRIIDVIGKNVPNKINLTIVSYSDYRTPINIEEKYEDLREFINKNKLAINLSIVLTKQSNKQHDRAILTNYFMISSGDSFNYYNSRGDVITKGTDIRFDSYCNPNIFQTSEVKLNSVKKVIKRLELDPDVDKRIIGNIKSNALLKMK